MTRLLVAFIWIYRILAAPWRRRPRCLFARSCSHYVEDVAREQGFRAGVRAARQRLSACRPGYSFVFDENGWLLECRNGMRVDPSSLSPLILSEFELVHAGLRANPALSASAARS
jgi:putative component of membrane protein insertase Oxa1/YidC/SpoIIIJ protein YidD